MNETHGPSINKGSLKLRHIVSLNRFWLDQYKNIVNY